MFLFWLHRISTATRGRRNILFSGCELAHLDRNRRALASAAQHHRGCLEHKETRQCSLAEPPPTSSPFKVLRLRPVSSRHLRYRPRPAPTSTPFASASPRDSATSWRSWCRARATRESAASST